MGKSTKSRGSLLAQCALPDAKKRRQMLGPYFSKSTVRHVEPIIQNKIDTFLKKLGEYGNKPRTLDLSRTFRCLTVDIVMQYTYLRDFGALQSQDFVHPLIEAAKVIVGTAQYNQHYPGAWQWLHWMIVKLPCSWTKHLLAPIAILQKTRGVSSLRRNC